MKKNFTKNFIVVLLVIIFGSSCMFPSLSGGNITCTQSNRNTMDIDDAVTVANSMILSQENSEYSVSNFFEVKNDEGATLMYVFYLDPKGYIVVTGNLNLPPIIAYSFSNYFGEISHENILLNLLKADISTRLKYLGELSENIIEKRNIQWQNILCHSTSNQGNLQKTTIGPLLDTHWTQNAPYNNFCPIDLASGQRSIAGCPAVAMAQILNYHKTIQNTRFDDDDDYVHNYAGNYYTIDDDYITYEFPSFPELNSYLDTLENHYLNEDPLTNDDKAAINFACGVAAKQVYNPGGSGTFGVIQAFQAYQRFSFQDVELLDENDPDLFDRLQSNILDELPAHIAVVNEQWTVGHNMVVDGYDDGYYHINFGWGGAYDGWYLLPDDLPYELTVIEGIIVDIIPIYSTSNLDGSGVLKWSDVEPGSSVEGNFTIENIGDPGSLLDWKISDWPTWGNWTFNIDEGYDLTPEDGAITIQVTIVAPEEKNKGFTGDVEIVNIENPEDKLLIKTSLVTPTNQIVNYILMKLFENHPLLFFIIGKVGLLN